MAKRKKKKDWIMIGGAIAVIMALVFVLVPGLGASLASLITGPDFCNNAPFAWTCICGLGFDKVVDPSWGGAGMKYMCIPGVQPKPYEFPISLDDPDYESKVFAYAQDHLTTTYPDCNTIACESPLWKNYASFEYEGVTEAYLECLEQTMGPDGEIVGGGQIWWSIVFSLDDGTIFPGIGSSFKTFCYSKT